MVLEKLDSDPLTEVYRAELLENFALDLGPNQNSESILPKLFSPQSIIEFKMN